MSRPATVDQLEPGELAREPRSLGLIAYYDGWGQAIGLKPMTYPRTLTDAEGEHWQEGWDEGKAHVANWESATRTMERATPVVTPPPDGFRPAPNHSSRWLCAICEVRGLPGGKWMETHRRTHHRCPDCGRWLTAKLDGTRRVHTRCPKKGATWSTSPREKGPAPVDGCCPACGKYVALALKAEPPQWACIDIDCVHGSGHPLPGG